MQDIICPNCKKVVILKNQMHYLLPLTTDETILAEAFKL